MPPCISYINVKQGAYESVMDSCAPLFFYVVTISNYMAVMVVKLIAQPFY